MRRTGQSLATVGLLLGVLVVLLAAAVPASGALGSASFRGRPLIEVLGELRARGLPIVFSTAVVTPQLRVLTEPVAREPRALLDQILHPLGLRAAAGPGGTLLVLPRPADDPGNTPSGGGRRGPAELEPEPPKPPRFVASIVVTPSHSVSLHEPDARHAIGAEEADLVPTSGGDVSRVVQLLPGVAAAEQSAAFSLRGSLPSDVSMVLDGLELYAPFHLQGLQSPYSLVDGNCVSRIEFTGGGYTADRGDRHGGFIDLETLEPTGAGQAEVEIGTVNSRVAYRSTLAEGAGAWLVSARGWYPDTLLDATVLGSRERIYPSFGDLYLKATRDWTSTSGRHHRVAAHALLAYDHLRFQETTEVVNEQMRLRSHHAYLWLDATSVWSERWTTASTLAVGNIEQRRDGISVDGGEILVADERLVDLLFVEQTAAFELTDDHLLKAGANLRSLDAHYRYRAEVRADPTASRQLSLDPDGVSVGGHLAYRMRWTPRLATEIGARWDAHSATDDATFNPRLNAVWWPLEGAELRLALGRFSQSQRIHELRIEDGESRFGRAEHADQAELSLQYRLRPGLHLRVDGYHHRVTDLRSRYENLFNPVELFPETTMDRVQVAPSAARLRGLELLVRGDPAGPLRWWAGYTLAEAVDIFADTSADTVAGTASGSVVPRSWDQTHAAKFLVGYRRGTADDSGWSVSLSGQFHSGWPTTPMTAAQVTDASGAIQIATGPGPRNSDRFPAYARLDLKAQRGFAIGRSQLWLAAEVLNLTDRANACCVNEFAFEPQPDGTVRVTRDLDDWLGITPSFSVRWLF